MKCEKCVYLCSLVLLVSSDFESESAIIVCCDVHICAHDRAQCPAIQNKQILYMCTHTYEFSIKESVNRNNSDKA